MRARTSPPVSTRKPQSAPSHGPRMTPAAIAGAALAGAIIALAFGVTSAAA